MTHLPTSDNDEPIPLADACKLFPLAKLTIWMLRTRAACGDLDIFKMGKRYFTTPHAMREMVRRCREKECRRASPSKEDTGASEMEQIESAQDALNQTLKALQSSSGNTSPTGTHRKRATTR